MAISPEHKIHQEMDEGGQLREATCKSGDTGDGPYLSWHPNGKLRSSGAQQKEKLHGRITRWFDTGLKRDEILWNNGVPEGDFTVWTPDGAVLERGEYHDGVPLIQAPRWSKSISLGLSALRYREGPIEYNSLSLVPKLSVFFRPLKRLELSTRAFMTGEVLSQRGSDAAVRFYGVNLAAGVTAWRSPSLRLVVAGGMYFSGMTVTDNRFGYKTVLGQLYPSIEWKFHSATRLFSYLKWAPLLRGNVSLFDAEVAAGFSLIRNTGNHQQWSLNVDLSRFEKQLNPAFRILSQQASIGVGYAF